MQQLIAYFFLASLCCTVVAKVFGNSDVVSSPLGLGASECEAIGSFSKLGYSRDPDRDRAGYCYFYNGDKRVSLEITRKRYDLSEHVRLLSPDEYSKYIRELEKLKKNCLGVQELRARACRKKNDQLFHVSEAFIPMCLSVDGFDGHLRKFEQFSKPMETLKDLQKRVDGVDDKSRTKYLFAQLVAAIYALHAVGEGEHPENTGKTLKEMTFENVAVGPFSTLALIKLDDLVDLDATVSTNDKSAENLIWDAAVLLAGCKNIEQVGSRPDKKATLTCLKNNWEPDPKFEKVFGEVLDAASDRARKTRVMALFRTPFVQDILEREVHWKALQYSWTRTDGCLSWTSDKQRHLDAELEFGYRYKCDTVPTFKEDICPPSASAACFTLRKNEKWECHDELPKRPCREILLPKWRGETYEAACLMPRHVGYQYAMELGIKPTITTAKTTTTTTLQQTSTTSATSREIEDTTSTSITVTTVTAITTTTTTTSTTESRMLTITTTTSNATNQTITVEPTTREQWSAIPGLVSICLVVAVCVGLDIGSSAMISRRQQRRGPATPLVSSNRQSVSIELM